MKKLIVVIIALIFGCNSFGQTSSKEELKKDINKLFESYAHYNRFIGNVLISQDNTIIYERSFGYANIEDHKKNTKNSIFSIASVTKPLTAVGIMKLVEDGRLTLESPIITYFPNFIPDFSKDITIRHLLNHSSGMQANIGRIDDEGNGLMPEEYAITLDELLEKFKDSKLIFEPGKGYEYNNFGYSLLAYIIEKVSEKSYADYMQEAVFKPANMKNTAVDSYNSTSERAFPHSGLGLDKFKKLSYTVYSSWIIGAGNINSTTGDLHNFMKALENGTLLNPDSVDKLYSYTQSRDINDTEYGLGWRIENKGGEKWINHTGLLPGHTSLIGLLKQRNIKIIILSNATATDLEIENSFQGKSQFVDGEISDNVVAILQNKKPELLPLEVKNSPKNSADFSRTYALDKEHVLSFTKQGDAYSLSTKNNDSWSVFTYPFSKSIKEESSSLNVASFFANAWSTQNFKGLSKHATKEMNGLFDTEEGINQLKGIWASFIKNAGPFKSYNIFKTEGLKNKTVHIRFHFEKDDKGIVLGINSANLIQGMFKDNNVKTSHVAEVKLIPVGENVFFINGFQNNGMQDLKIKVSDTELILIDDKTSFKASILSSF